MMLFILLLTIPFVIHAAVNPLGPYKVSDVTVSGLSSGAYMAVQMHVTYSSVVNGSAVFAGGPYFCAQANLMTAEYQCMKTYEGTPDINRLVTITKQYETAGSIDKTTNMKDDRVYIFSGSADSVVDPKVVSTLETYYQNFITTDNILTKMDLKAEHCFPTLSYGENCATLSSPYIGKCNFDGAEASFKQLYGSGLSAKTTAVTANLMQFSQTPYLPSTKASLADTGYIYVPTACKNGTTCRLHVALHGCEQNQDLIDNQWASKIGYNEWAESNNVIVLYPYTKRSSTIPSNPNGCWDWWGYTDKNYANNKGVQMQFVRSLIKAVSGI